MDSMALTPELKDKYNKLKELISSYPNLLVAYSGGVDSTLLLKIAFDVLGENTIGIIGISPSIPGREVKEAQEIARKFNLPFALVETHEMDDAKYSRNPENRCYYCKKELFGELYDYAAANGFTHLADGTNLDDATDHRPGRQAAAELHVVSPLSEAGLQKQHIRQLSRFLGLPTWNKPALACLSSRFPTGTPITGKALHMVEEAEDYLYSRDFKILRVRHHGKLARIEVGEEEINRLLDDAIRKEIYQRFREIGYAFVSLDLAGYRQGSLNQLLEGQTTRNDLK